MNNDKTTTAGKIAIGAGVVAAASAAAGAYWLYGAKHSAQHRKMAKSWMLSARAEVLDAVEKLQDVDKESYMAVVEKVLQNYTKKIDTTPAEIASMMRDFKAAWSHMQEAKKTTIKGAKTVKKTGKKITRSARRVIAKK